MRYRHPDGSDAAARMRLPGTEMGSAEIDEEGVYDAGADVPAELHERLVDLGHEPLDAPEPDEEADDTGAAEERPRASDFSERELVEGLGYRDLQSIAAGYEHISGNASEEKLTEELIKQRREEVGEQ